MLVDCLLLLGGKQILLDLTHHHLLVDLLSMFHHLIKLLPFFLVQFHVAVNYDSVEVHVWILHQVTILNVRLENCKVVFANLFHKVKHLLLYSNNCIIFKT